MKIIILVLALCLLSIILSLSISSCAKEFSCENCKPVDTTVVIIPPDTIPPIDTTPPVDTVPPVDTITIPPVDTIPVDTTWNELMVWYSWQNQDNSKVKAQYFCVRTKYIPGHFQIIDEIPVQNSPSSYYNGWLNIKSYRDQAGTPNLGRIFYADQFQKGDKFDYFFQIRYKDGTMLMTDTITLTL